MRNVVLDKRIYDKCNEAIIVSGGARSGTTIMGKIFHSFEEVEYVFEPPMLFSLFSLLSMLDEGQWKLLYETYLYEEFLINALAGRGINCNRVDDSSIYKVKPNHLIEQRLGCSLPKKDIECLAGKSKIVYKMPDVVAFFPKLKRYYPGAMIIIMTRKAPEVFNSILEKGWFGSQTLRQKNLNWPNRFADGLRIPFWVDPKDDELWYNMDELHRIAYYYLMVNKPIKQIQGCITVKYDDLIKNPTGTIRSLADILGLEWGEKTDEILKTVRRTKKDRDYDILKQLKPEIRDEVEYYSSIS